MKRQGIKFLSLKLVGRITLFTICGIIVLVFSSLLILQLPSVQKKLVERFVGSINNESGFTVSVDTFYMRWYDRLHIGNMRIIAPDGDTLIAVKEFEVNYEFFNFFDSKSININAVQVHGAEVNLVNIPDSIGGSNLNIDLLIKYFKNRFSSSQNSGRVKKIQIGEINIENSRLSYSNTGSYSIINGFDYQHFRLDLDQGNFTGIQVASDTISFRVADFQISDEKTNFKIEDLSTDFKASNKFIKFNNLILKTKNSRISDSLTLSFDSPNDFANFYEKVTFSAYLNNTTIDPADLQKLIPNDNWTKHVKISGVLLGTVSDFNFNDMTIALGTSQISGNLFVKGLPKIKDTFFKAQIKPSHIELTDFQTLMTKQINQFLNPLQEIYFTGTFSGLPNDFVCNGIFDTAIGKIQSNINYKLPDDELHKPNYSGNLSLEAFDLGRMLKDTVAFQNVDFFGSIIGSGLMLEDADFLLDGNINSIGINNYIYKNITTHGKFKNQFFDGDLRIADPNFKLQLSGSVDLRSNKNDIFVKARLDSALLKNINLTKRELFLSSDVLINTHGLNLDSINGTVAFKNLTLRHQEQTIELDSIKVISINENGKQNLNVRSSVLDLSMVGDYSFQRLFNDLPRFLTDIKSKIKNEKIVNDDTLNDTFSKRPYQANFSMRLHDVNPILSFMGINMEVSSNGDIHGSFRNDSISNFNVFAQVDTIRQKSQELIDNELSLNFSKTKENVILDASLLAKSKKQILSKNFTTNNFCLEGYWDNNNTGIELNLGDDKNDSFINLNASLKLLSEGTQIKFNPSVIRLLGENWDIDKSNNILVNGTELEVRNLNFSHYNQLVRINGLISDDPKNKIEIDIQNFEASFLNSFSSNKFEGVLNSKIELYKSNSTRFFNNTLTVDSLKIDDVLFGNIDLKNYFNSDNNVHNISLNLDRLGSQIIVAEGLYDHNKTIDPLSAKIFLKNANLILLDPLISHIITIGKGNATGNFELLGTLLEPRFYGEAKVTDGEVTINYLKTMYKTSGTIALTPNQIQFKNLDLLDEFNNSGNFSGYISHVNFYKMAVQFYSNFSNFQLLNTVAKDNELFYGTAYCNGNINIKGPISDINITSHLETGQNTRFFIPITNTASSEKKDFIQFNSFTKQKMDVKERKISTTPEISGLTIDIDLDVTPDAYTEIIFDIKTGDIIRGRGQGNLKLFVDTKGDFTMHGGIDFTEGAYNFTLYNFVNKEFSIKPGSRINWSGDPYLGDLDITASYSQFTSIAPILTDLSVTDDPIIKRKYPVIVLLKLDGPMLSPNVNFDIDGEEIPTNVVTTTGQSVRLKLEFDTFKSRLDEQGLLRQIFSLMVLRKLSPLYNFESVGGRALYNSMSELLSNQLSYWLSQVDQNLEIDFDLGTLDQQAINTLQLRLSYSFLNGRLRISKNGQFGNPSAQSELSTLVGDWSISYLLTPDGKFNIKMYSRSGVNQIQNPLNPNEVPITTGASLSYTKNFNKISDIWRSKRSKKRKKSKSNEQVNSEELIDN